MTKKYLSILFCLLSLVASLSSKSFAEDKNWSGEGDQTDFFNDANWLPAGKPTAEDDAKIDMRDTQVEVGQAFDAKSLTIGGKKNSTVNVSNFVTGTLEPSDPANDALVLLRDGKLILKGSAGKITLKGGYKDSEEVIPDEPSFMLYVK